MTKVVTSEISDKVIFGKTETCRLGQHLFKSESSLPHVQAVSESIPKQGESNVF